MPAQADAVGKSVAFMKEKFAKYYRSAQLKFPGEIGRREWAFLYFDSKGGMHRPVAFESEASARDFLAGRSPAHAYFSSAYYEDPAVPMAEKRWLGADLIFDLDADHIHGAEKMTYGQQLEKVRERFIYLLDEFLARDFVQEKDIEIAFSGGRGYHAHVHGEKIRLLRSSERREIVDYITATGVEDPWLFPEVVVGASSFRGHHHKQTARLMPAPKSGGWRGRTARGILRLLERWESMTREEAIREMTAYEGIGPTRAARMYRELFDEMSVPGGEISRVGDDGKVTSIKRATIRGADKIRDENNIEFGETSGDFRKIVKQMLSVSEAAETDEPVTSDVKRIIRMPTSLHGKTGFVTLPLTRKALDSFDPLRDATAPAFGQEAVKLNVSKEVEITLRGERFVFSPGPVEAPEFAAVFLVGRGAATPV